MSWRATIKKDPVKLRVAPHWKNTIRVEVKPIKGDKGADFVFEENQDKISSIIKQHVDSLTPKILNKIQSKIPKMPTAKDGNGWILFDSEVDDSQGSDKDFALVKSTADFYLKVSGRWEKQGSFRLKSDNKMMVGGATQGYVDSAIANAIAGVSGQASIQFEDEGSPLGSSGTVNEIDFTGSGVTATRIANRLTVDITGGGGGGGISRTVASVSSNTNAGSAGSTDYVYLLAAGAQLTMPTAVGNTNRYTIKVMDATTATVVFSGGQNADGSTTLSLTTQYTTIDLVSSGSNWAVI